MELVRAHFYPHYHLLFIGFNIIIDISLSSPPSRPSIFAPHSLYFRQNHLRYPNWIAGIWNIVRDSMSSFATYVIDLWDNANTVRRKTKYANERRAVIFISPYRFGSFVFLLFSFVRLFAFRLKIILKIQMHAIYE